MTTSDQKKGTGQYHVVVRKGWSYVEGNPMPRDSGPWRYRWEAQEYADDLNAGRTTPGAPMGKLTEGQKRLLNFAAAGGQVHSLRPGSNEAPDVEFQYSTKGVGLFVDAVELENLFRRGLFQAKELPKPMTNDGLTATHEAIITAAGRAALAQHKGQRNE